MEEARAEERREQIRTDIREAFEKKAAEDVERRAPLSVGGRVGGPRRAHAKRRAIRRNQ